MQKIINPIIGADIELFLKNETTNEIMSAEGFIEGTKEQPFIFDTANKFFATSLDNVMCEFGIPPAKTADEFYANIQKSIGYINHNLPPGLCTVALPSANLHERWLQSVSSTTFGCEPDFNAYTLKTNVFEFGNDPTLRSAGGHIHIGMDNPPPYFVHFYKTHEDHVQIVKALDLFLGIPSVILEPDNKRKLLYGKAGCYRPKPYGVEYRTLSNYYVNSEGAIKWVYGAAMNAIEWLNEGNSISDTMGKTIETVINTNNKKAAEKIIKSFKLSII